MLQPGAPSWEAVIPVLLHSLDGKELAFFLLYSSKNLLIPNKCLADVHVHVAEEVGAVGGIQEVFQGHPRDHGVLQDHGLDRTPLCTSRAPTNQIKSLWFR